MSVSPAGVIHFASVAVECFNFMVSAYKMLY